MATNNPGPGNRVPGRSAMSQPGHRNVVVAWVIGMIVIGLACWGVARLVLMLQPQPMQPNAVSNGVNGAAGDHTGANGVGTGGGMGGSQGSRSGTP